MTLTFAVVVVVVVVVVDGGCRWLLPVSATVGCCSWLMLLSAAAGCSWQLLLTGDWLLLAADGIRLVGGLLLLLLHDWGMSFADRHASPSRQLSLQQLFVGCVRWRMGLSLGHLENMSV